jgi:drug/metabolite transporter (DMT)-like permease
VLMAWWAAWRHPAAEIGRKDWIALGWLGFIGYYAASLLDFVGLEYITAGLERLILFLYPTLVVLLSAALFRRRIGARALAALGLSYAGILLVFMHDRGFAGASRAMWLGSGLVFASAFCYALYLVACGPVIARLGSLRFIAWAMLISSAFVFAQFLATRPMVALAQPLSIHLLSLAMALCSTVLPTYLIAEAIKRIGADRTSLIGSLGPVFTIALGYWMLGEPVHAVQIAGAALVLAGVTLVTLRAKTA